MWWSLKRNPLALGAAMVLILIVAAAVAAPLVAPQDPFDLSQLDLMNSALPPAWELEGQAAFPFGSDNQGRDVLSAILYGSRISLLIGVATVVLSFSVGVMVGLAAGYFGGRIDNMLMRIGDTILSIPTILVAILVTSVVREMLPANLREGSAALILVLAISVTSWVQYARTVRAATLVERGKDYVQAAKLIGVKPHRIMIGHILPNALTPVMVTATLSFGLAILIEASLSFLGLGMPPNQPSLGTLVRIGNQYLFSGQWWVVLFPSIYLCILVLAVNLLGDWLRDVLNPRLR